MIRFIAFNRKYAYLSQIKVGNSQFILLLPIIEEKKKLLFSSTYWVLKLDIILILSIKTFILLYWLLKALEDILVQDLNKKKCEKFKKKKKKAIRYSLFIYVVKKIKYSLYIMKMKNLIWWSRIGPYSTGSVQYTSHSTKVEQDCATCTSEGSHDSVVTWLGSRGRNYYQPHVWIRLITDR